MTLFEYMRKNNITKIDLAHALGYSESAIMQLFRHKFPVSRKFANMIEMYTKGEVKSKELLKRSQLARKKREEYIASMDKEEAAAICYGVCRVCNKKLNEIEL